MGNWKKFISRFAPTSNFAEVSIFQTGKVNGNW